jgi:predicted permease
VLSYAFWMQLGGDSSLVGRSLELNGIRFQVMGVMPPASPSPRAAQLFVPYAMSDRQRSLEWRRSLFMTAYARMQPMVTTTALAEQLRVEAARWHERLAAAYRPEMRHALLVVPFVEHAAGQLRPLLLILMVAVGFVLLVACANVASLQLVRAAERGKEIAVRAALGAGRGTIARQLLLENAVLGLGGGLLGLGMGALMLRLLRGFDTPELRALESVRLDGTVLAFTFAATVLAVLLFGTIPSLRASRVDLQDALRESSRAATAGIGRHRFLQASVVTQIALALVLLLGSTLAVRSLVRLLDASPGYRSAQVLTMRLSLGAARYDQTASRAAFWDALLARARSAPGALSAGLVVTPPIMGSNSSPFTIDGHEPLPGEPRKHANMNAVAGDYFQAMGIPLLRGRMLGPNDGGPPVGVLIDERLAKEFFGAADPIGHTIAQGRPGQIVGIVGSIKQEALDDDEKAVVYYPHTFYDSRTMSLVLRTAVDPAIMTRAIRAIVTELDPQLPLYDVLPMAERVARSVAPRRLAVTVLGGFAGLSLLLAILGVSGVIGYAMSQRTREIGIRVALGAQPGDVRRLVLTYGLTMALAGTAAGVLLFLAVGKWLTALLYGIGPRDPVTILGGAAALALTALVATWWPARRAARVDPMVALRSA